MNYSIGMKLKYVPKSKFEREEIVEVIDIRKKGVKLSNGWLADEDGIVEGTNRRPGGKVVQLQNE